MVDYPITSSMQMGERDALAGQRDWRVLLQAVGWRWEALGEGRD